MELSSRRFLVGLALRDHLVHGLLYRKQQNVIEFRVATHVVEGLPVIKRLFDAVEERGCNGIKWSLPATFQVTELA